VPKELEKLINNSGFTNLAWENGILILVGLCFIYLAIAKKREPYELLPIGLGIILANLPLTRLTDFDRGSGDVQTSGIFGVIFFFGLSFWSVLPPLVFLGLGAMTDFGPIIAKPKTLLLGVAAQLGIFVAFWLALIVQFDMKEAAAIGIIGGADGPTTIFASAKLAPELLGIIGVIAYTYMAGVAFIQPPLMRLLTTKAEREIYMPPPREVSRIEKLLFPTVAMLLIILLVPQSAPLVAFFMVGNLFRESGVVPRLTNSASNEILNIATIFLMLAIGTQLAGEKVVNLETLLILGLGLTAFAFGTAGGLLLAKAMNLFSKDKINPLIGSAGVSAVPMAARISHEMAQEANPSNYILPYAMGPNVAGVIGSAVVAGVFLNLQG
jgi:sodium ion-translocating decarboxylase beta subunit